MQKVLLGLIALSASIGCEEGPIPIQTAPVSGTATLGGKPLEDYRVFFFIPGEAAQEPASGRVNADGTFTLSVRDVNDGAIVGVNQVWLTYDPALPEPEPGHETAIVVPPPKIKVPEKYLDRFKSGLTVDVPPEGLKDYKLELE